LRETNLKEELLKQETDELIHKVSRGQLTEEAEKIAREIIHQRGHFAELTKQDGVTSNDCETYTGLTADEKLRLKHLYMTKILNFFAPLCLSLIGWIVILYFSKMSESILLNVITNVFTLVAILYSFVTFYKYATKYDSNDFLIYPTVVILSPTVIYLIIRIVYLPFN
jgi:hypothetical protein